MAVRLIPCRNTETGALADVPETALQHMPAFVPVDEADRRRLGYTDDPAAPASAEDAGTQTAPAGDPAADDTSSSRPATGAAKTKKENTRHGD